MNKKRFEAIGTKLIISQEKSEKDVGGLIISDTGKHRIGKILSIGEKASEKLSLGVDDEVVFILSKSFPLGFGADPNVVIIDAEDVIVKVTDLGL